MATQAKLETAAVARERVLFSFYRRIISGIELIGDRVEALVKATNFWLFPCAIDAP